MRGRTLTHEIGHWLGLYHPFQGGCTNISSRTDQVDDTPPVDEPSYGCTAGQNPNTCNNDFPNEIDNVENFMDYANGGCMNMFTQGQKTRVNNYFSSPTGRAYVISAATHLATGINTNPSCGPIADFWYGQDEIEICAGQSMTFDGLSYNGEITSRTWTFEGGTPATSSDEDPVITYNTPGVYKVELEVGNGTGSDKLTRNLFVRVLPSVSEFKAPYGVDFSDGSDDWNLQVGEDGTGWKQNNVRGFSGSKCLEMDIDASSLGSTTYTAIMPPVDMTTQANAKLHFKHAYARRTSSGSAEVLIVRVSSDCQKTWSTLKGYSAVLLATEDASPNWVPTSKAHWAKKEIDLSNYNDAESLYIRFDVLCNSGNSVFLDDINVGQHPLSVPSYVRDFNVWLQPNPAQNKLEVKVTQNINDATISIVDITGRLLLQQNLDGTSLEVNTSELAKGVYTVILVSEGVKWSKKLIISK